jgi:hypothetical protein
MNGSENRFCDAAGMYYAVQANRPAISMRTLVLPGQRGGVAALQSRRHSAALRKTGDVIREFNRDTRRLAAQVLGAVGFAILVLGVQTRERDPEAIDLRGNESLTSRDLLANVTPPVPSKVDGLKEKSATDGVTSKLTTREGHAFTEISPDETSSTWVETLEFAQIRVPALNQPAGGRTLIRGLHHIRAILRE